MTTLGTMKTRISTEMKRPDLYTDGTIEAEIKSAIDHYRSKKFWFNEKRGQVTFNTVADQSDYTSADHADIPHLIHVDYITITIDSDVKRLRPISSDRMELLLGDSGATSGDPYCYSYYAQALRLYQTPDDVYAMRVAGSFRIAAPASDSETDNPWMVDAEEMIRMRAESKMWANRLHNVQAATLAKSQEEEAFKNLVRETSARAGVSTIVSSD